MKTRRKGANPNPVPRTVLPDVDAILEDYKDHLDKICRDIKKHWYWFIKIPDIEDEIRQNVLLVFYTEWDLYRRGVIDSFPPKPGYIYITAFRKFECQYAPRNDLYRHIPLEHYNTIEGGYRDSMALFGHNPGRARLSETVVTRSSNLPLNDTEKAELPTQDKNLPDLVDLWWMGFSINTLAVIYNVAPNTTRARLHNYYDAMEVKGIKTFRDRPRRRKKKWNRFKMLKHRSNVSKHSV